MCRVRVPVCCRLGIWPTLQELIDQGKRVVAFLGMSPSFFLGLKKKKKKKEKGS